MIPKPVFDLKSSLPTKSVASTVNVQYSPGFNLEFYVKFKALNCSLEVKVGQVTCLASQSSTSL